MSAYVTGDGWAPAVELDLGTASKAAFKEAMEALAAEAKKRPPPGPLTLPNGWYDVTPRMAEDFLFRTPVNRPTEFADVRKYYHAMKIGEWHATGQPLIFNTDGVGQDLGHRCAAGYFGKVTFKSYIVTDAPVDQFSFVYIDDGRTRSAADALKTSGMNGASSIIANAAKLAWRYENHALEIVGKQPKFRGMSKPECLQFAQANPLLGVAAHMMLGTYARAASIARNKGVLAMFAWKVLEHHDEVVLGEFLTLLGTGTGMTDDDPVVGLRNRLTLDAEAIKPELQPPHRLALIIHAFNMHVMGARLPIKRGKISTLSLADDAEYPRIEPIVAVPLAAE